MSQTIIIESNRNIAYSKEYQTESGTLGRNNNELFPNNKWKTHIGEGLQLPVGAEVQLEAAMINAVGSSDSVMEFLGRPSNATSERNEDDIVDNTANITFSYYITNRFQFNIPLPKMGNVIDINFRSMDYGNQDFSTYTNFLKNYYTQGLEGFFASGDPNTYSEITAFSATHNGAAHTKSYSVSFNNIPSNTRYVVSSAAYQGPYKTSPYEMFESTATLKVPEGFNTPGAIGEILTAQLHSREGPADNFQTDPERPTSFFLNANPNAATPGQPALNVEGFISPQVADKCLKCIPTTTGKLFYGRQRNNWSCAFPGEAHGTTAASDAGGTGYQPAQGNNIFYSYILTSKPEQVRGANIESVLRINALGGVHYTKDQHQNGVLYSGLDPNGDNVGYFGQNVVIFDTLDSHEENITYMNKPFKHGTNPYPYDGPTAINVAASKALVLGNGGLIPTNIPYSVGGLNRGVVEWLRSGRTIVSSNRVGIDPDNIIYKQSQATFLGIGRANDSDTAGAIAYRANLVNPYLAYLVDSGQIAEIPPSYPQQSTDADRFVYNNANNNYSFGQRINDLGQYELMIYTEDFGNGCFNPSSSAFNTGGLPDGGQITLGADSMWSLRDTQNRFINEHYPGDLASQFGIAVVPVYLKEQHVVGPNAHTTLRDLPFCAFVHAGNVGPTGGFINYPMLGEFFGYSPSLIDLDMGQIVNTQKTTTSAQGKDNTQQYPQGNSNANILSQIYVPYIMLGADNPTITFDGDVSRFAISGLGAMIKAGNKMPPWFQNDQGPKASTEATTEIVQCSAKESAISLLTRDASKRGAPLQFTEIQMIANGALFDFMASQGGIAIEGIQVISPKRGAVDMDALVPELYEGTLFQKLGFSVEQLLPIWGQRQNLYNRSNYNDAIGYDVMALDKKNNLVKPLTTNAYISGAINMAIAEVLGPGEPLENYSAAPRRAQVNANADPDEVQAINLPTKLDYPYLVVYSDIVDNPIYYGGPNGYDRLKAIAYITRNYSQGDFFYSFSTTWNYILDKPRLLTDITTDIRLPDGRPAPIDPNSSVIYKITIPQVLPAMPPPPKGKKNISDNSNNGNESD